VGMMPEELVKKRKADLKAEGLREKRKTETLLKKFIAHLDSLGLSVSMGDLGMRPRP